MMEEPENTTKNLIFRIEQYFFSFLLDDEHNR